MANREIGRFAVSFRPNLKYLNHFFFWRSEEMEQVIELKDQRAEEATVGDEQILELTLDLLPKVGGGTVNNKL